MSGEREHETHEGRVIVGVQDSVAGLQALRRGVDEARRRGATVYLVRAVNAPVRYPDGTVWHPEWAAVWAAEYAQFALATRFTRAELASLMQRCCR